MTRSNSKTPEKRKRSKPEKLDQFVELAAQLDFTLLGLTFSPVKGPEGNIEFLAHLTLGKANGITPDTAALVADAHNTLKG